MSGIMLSTMNTVQAVDTPYTPPTPETAKLWAWYDPKSSTSYPGTGTTLFDLSGSNRDATLVGPTYDSNGYFACKPGHTLKKPTWRPSGVQWQVGNSSPLCCFGHNLVLLIIIHYSKFMD